MNRKQLLIAFGLALVLGGLGWVVYQNKQAEYGGSQSATRSGQDGNKVFAQFPVNDIAQVTVRQKTNSVTLVKKDDVWTVKERGGYAANFSALREFMQKVWELRVTRALPKAGARQIDPGPPWWPGQALRDAAGCLGVAAVVFALALGLPDAYALGAPADPSEPCAAPRPEWMFLSLFQFLKYCGRAETAGAVLAPAALLGLAWFMPVFCARPRGRRLAAGFVCALAAGAAALTWLALAQDARNPDYQAARRQAAAEGLRARQLAAPGAPPAGALALLRED